MAKDINFRICRYGELYSVIVFQAIQHIFIRPYSITDIDCRIYHINQYICTNFGSVRLGLALASCAWNGMEWFQFRNEISNLIISHFVVRWLKWFYLVVFSLVNIHIMYGRTTKDRFSILEFWKMAFVII